MNANELAKYLDRLNGYMDMPRDILDIAQPAATMLRQQQAEIEALKYEKSSGVYDNEPVAWIGKDELQFGFTDTRVTNEKESWDDIPLYTHPAKEYKEPSVKEIEDLWLDVVNNIPANDHRPREWHFANAILRKVQE